MNKPIVVSEYELTRALPPSLQSALPTVEEIEAELTEATTSPATHRKAKSVRQVAKKNSKRARPGKGRRK